MPNKPSTTRTTKRTAPAAEASPKAAITKPRVASARHRTTKPKAVATHAEAIENSREAIAKIAYGYWEAREHQGGDPFSDWVRAEAEYMTRKAPLSSSQG